MAVSHRFEDEDVGGRALQLDHGCRGRVSSPAQTWQAAPSMLTHCIGRGDSKEYFHKTDDES